MKENSIEIAASHGLSFTGYVALPAQDAAPGLVLLHDMFGIDEHIKTAADRYAQEGYVVVVPDLFWRLSPHATFAREGGDLEKARDFGGRFDVEAGVDDVNATFEALRTHRAHAGKLGVLGYGLGGKLAFLAAARTDVDCAVAYSGPGFEAHLRDARHVRCPFVLHVSGHVASRPPTIREQIGSASEYQPGVIVYVYGCGEAFTVAGREFDRAAAALAHSRSVALLKKTMGPVYAIERVWKRHAYHKYVTRDIDAVMDTMVSDPYFNDIPTMTGGSDFDSLKHFYQAHFMYSIPADAQLMPVSRTVGIDRIVDEFVLCCTHSCEMHWMLPGIEPTGKYFEVAMVAIACFRGEKIDNMHVYWDQATVLVQIGKLDPAGLPVKGIESAQKVLDTSGPSNTLMPGWNGSDDKPA
jgi:carboxymethylenebutenolidase